MIKVENIDVWGFEHAIRGARNPLNSWNRMDSGYCKGASERCDTCDIRPSDDYAPCYFANKMKGKKYILGKNDLDLMRRLYNAGTEHRKYLRQIFVSMDITAPLYFWKQADQYKVGTVTNSCSTMHKIADKEFELDDFSHEHLISEYNQNKNHDIEYDEEFASTKVIDGYPDYEVSENGCVYSFKSGKKKQLSLRIDIDGYKTVGLYKDGNVKRFKVHRLVAMAFIDNDNPKKDCVNHKDGNKWNNNVNNLEWCTRSENSKHAVENGLMVTGSKQKIGIAKNRRFNRNQISDIKNLYESGISQRKIGEIFGCDHSVVSEIVNNKIYKDITIFPLEMLEFIVDELNELREEYLQTGNKEYWYNMIQLLPSSYNQKRTVTMNYENVMTIIKQRTGHKLDEWNEFVEILRDLPYVKEIIGE